MSPRAHKLLKDLYVPVLRRMRVAERAAASPPVREHRWSGLEPLEGRLLYSVSPLGADLLPPPAGHESIAAIEADSEPWAAFDQSEADNANTGAVDQHVRRELVIVDASTPDYQNLVEDILRGAGDARDIKVVVLDADRDGVDQITAILGEHRDLDALHLVSHGTDGGIQLGNGWLTTGNLGSYAEQIAGWGEGLTADGDVLLYGCDLATSAEGRGLVDALADLAGADVAASIDRTGHAGLGGDWDLEYTTGGIETAIAFSDDIQFGWRAVLDATNPLWISTSGDVGGGGQGGTDTWQKGDLVQMTGPGLTYASGPTDGEFSIALDIDLFAAGAKTNATHYVTADILVGASDFQLKAGDVLLSLGAGETLTSGSVATDPGFTNSLDVEKSDVFVFRPDTPGDYSTGTFAMLLEDLTGNDIRGISLIEHDVTVGKTDLDAGDFVFTVDDDGNNDVWLLETIDVGVGNTNGTLSVLLDGDDVGISIDKRIFGVDVLERNLMVGDRLLAAGTVLLSVDNGDTIGTNDLTVTKFDIFALDVKQSTLFAGVGNGAATASAFFVGDEVAFDGGTEKIDGFTLTSVNEASVVTAASASLSYTENDVATAIDSGLTVTDIDDWDLDGATVRITSGFAAGEDVLAFTNQLGITGSYDAATGVLTLSGTSSVANYQTALRTVTYQNTSDDPSATTREITFEVNDGDNLGSATRDIAITVENDQSVVTTTVIGPAYVENDAATAIDPAVTVSDVDDTVLEGATVTIDAGLAAGEDVLAFTDQLGITGTYDAATGVLTLSGTSSVANYQVALRSVTYENTSDDPSGALRMITFRVDDGDALASDASNVTVTSVNDGPALIAAGSNATHSGTIVITTAMLHVTDIESTAGEITYTLTSPPTDGVLRLDGAALRAGDTFTQANIDDGRLTYDLSVVGDAFEFTVGDGDGGVIGATDFAVAVTAPILPPVIPAPHGPEPPEVAVETEHEPVVEEAEAEAEEEELLAELLTPEPVDAIASVVVQAPGIRPEAPSVVEGQAERGTTRDSTTRAERDDIRITSPLEDANVPGMIIARLAGADIDFSPQVGALWDQLDDLKERLTSTASDEVYVAGTATFVFAGVSAGYAVALVRGGSLIGSMLSSMPAWQFVDPLPILDHPGACEGSEAGDDESLASMIEDASG